MTSSGGGFFIVHEFWAWQIANGFGGFHFVRYVTSSSFHSLFVSSAHEDHEARLSERASYLLRYIGARLEASHEPQGSDMIIWGASKQFLVIAYHWVVASKPRWFYGQHSIWLEPTYSCTGVEWQKDAPPICSDLEFMWVSTSTGGDYMKRYDAHITSILPPGVHVPTFRWKF